MYAFSCVTVLLGDGRISTFLLALALLSCRIYAFLRVPAFLGGGRIYAFLCVPVLLGGGMSAVLHVPVLLNIFYGIHVAMWIVIWGCTPAGAASRHPRQCAIQIVAPGRCCMNLPDSAPIRTSRVLLPSPERFSLLPQSCNFGTFGLQQEAAFGNIFRKGKSSGSKGVVEHDFPAPSKGCSGSGHQQLARICKNKSNA